MQVLIQVSCQLDHFRKVHAAICMSSCRAKKMETGQVVIKSTKDLAFSALAEGCSLGSEGDPGLERTLHKRN